MINRPYIWHSSHWQIFHQCIIENKMPHATLVAGENGIGKTEFVQALSQKLLCQIEGVNACGQCKSCRLYLAQSHPDIIQIGLLDKSKQIKIDQIRQIIDLDSQTPQISPRKIIIINPADAMNINASNALLKCLEEPAGDTILILQSDTPSRILPTVRSRCQSFMLEKPGIDEADEWLSSFVDDKSMRDTLLVFSRGNPIKALKLHSQETMNHYQAYLGQLVSLANHEGSIVSFANSIQKTNVDGWLEFMQVLLWHLIKRHYIPGFQSDTFDALYYLTERDNFSFVGYHLLENVQKAKSELSGPGNPNIVLLVESVLYRWQRFIQSL